MQAKVRQHSDDCQSDTRCDGPENKSPSAVTRRILPTVMSFLVFLEPIVEKLLNKVPRVETKIWQNFFALKERQ